MRWLILAGGALAAVIVVVVIVGALLPRDHVATVTARIAGTPDSVWQAITNVGEHGNWRDGVKRVELLPPRDGRMLWREHSSNGQILMIADHTEQPHRF